MPRRHVPPGGTAATIAIGIVVLFVASSVAGGASSTPVGQQSPSHFGVLLRPAGSSNPIDHIIIVFQENHVYDQFYGTYCQAVGPYCDVNGTGYPAGLCVPLNPAIPSQGCQDPYLAASSLVTSPLDLVHDWGPAHTAYDNGSMDGFYQAENQQISTFAYYNGAELPTYWDLAEQYGIGDNFFASVLSYSTPNHWFLVAGQSPDDGLSQSFHRPVTNPPVLSGTMEEYLNESNATATIADLLANSSVSWKYYDYALPTYSQAINAKIGAGSAGSAFDFWNPFASIASSYTPAMKSHFVSSSSFLTDAAAGTLPNVSWVLPTFNNSDHPPASLNNGQGWVASVVNAVEASPDWNSSAIFITWDDYGGYYDHVPPPPLDANGVSFRAPLIVVSPYAREGFISHQFTYFESLLHLIEWRYGLPSLTSRDANAPLPLDYFDFSSAPRSPLHIGTPATHASYPVARQGLGLPKAPGLLTAAPGPASMTLNWTLGASGAAVTTYQLVYGPSTNPTLNSMRVAGNLQSVTVTNLPPGVAYQFSLTSITGANRSVPVYAVGTPGAGTTSTPMDQPATWTALPAAVGSAPVPRAGAGFVYDTSDRADVLFGGVTSSGLYLGDTWEYLGGKWVKLNLTRPPPPRAYGGMVYDSTDGVVVLFGGQGAHGLLGDTWKFSAGTWTNITAAVAKSGKVPSARAYPALSDNPGASGVLLFGGKGTSSTFGDSWRYAKGKWTAMTLKTNPSPRWGAAVTYDPVDGYAVMFGGNNSGGSPLNDTWRFSSGAWTQVLTLASPGPRSGAVMAFDSADGYVVLCGGAYGGTLATGAWRYLGGGWSLLNPTVSPTERTFASEAYDGLHAGLLMAFGLGPVGNPNGMYEYGVPIATVVTDSPSFADAPALVTFFPTVTGGMVPYHYLWTFGDGTNSTLVDATHLFSVPGTYHVVLTVSDAVGAPATVTIPVAVEGPLTVIASASPSTPNGTVAFGSEVGGGLPPFTYSWDFGDGSVPAATSSNPVHAYGAPGSYNVTLSVSDADGSYATSSLAVSTDTGALDVSLVANATVGVAPANLSFSANITGGAGPYTYEWEFGDGSTCSNLSNPSHNFTAAGRYTVAVNVSDSSGAWGTSFVQVTIDPSLRMAPIVASNSGSAGNVVSFSVPVTGGQGPYQYRWLFGDGTSSTEPSPTHAFGSAGGYTVALTVTDRWGVTRSVESTVTVAGTPPLSAGAGPAPLSVPPAGGPANLATPATATASSFSGPASPSLAAWRTRRSDESV